MVIAADILDEVGIELDPTTLTIYLKDITQRFVKNTTPYILDFHNKHPHI